MCVASGVLPELALHVPGVALDFHTKNLQQPCLKTRIRFNDMGGSILVSIRSAVHDVLNAMLAEPMLHGSLHYDEARNFQ